MPPNSTAPYGDAETPSIHILERDIRIAHRAWQALDRSEVEYIERESEEETEIKESGSANFEGTVGLKRKCSSMIAGQANSNLELEGPAPAERIVSLLDEHQILDVTAIAEGSPPSSSSSSSSSSVSSSLVAVAGINPPPAGRTATTTGRPTTIVDTVHNEIPLSMDVLLFHSIRIGSFDLAIIKSKCESCIVNRRCISTLSFLFYKS